MTKITLPILAISLSFVTPAYAQTGMVNTACGDDIEKYCGDTAHIGGAVRLCLEEHFSQVSLECRQALETAGPRNQLPGWAGWHQRSYQMGLRQIVATVEGLGYTDISEIELEGGHYEIEALNPEGVAVELYVDAVTGKVLRVKREDG